MSPRSWVTLSLRLVGLVSVLWGVYNLIVIIQVTSSPVLASIREMASRTPVKDMFGEEALRPNYLGPGLWIGVGLLLIAVSKPLTRMLFSGLEPAAAPKAPTAP
jgi:hypothetical protein